MMKKNKKIAPVFVLLNIGFSLFAQNIRYGFLRDSSAKFNEQIFEIKENEIIDWKIDPDFCYIDYNPYKDDFEISIFSKVNGVYALLASKDLKIIGSSRIFENDFIQLIPVYYLEFLKTKNVDVIFKNQPNWKDFTSSSLYDFGGTFKSAFRPEKITLSNIACLFNLSKPNYIFTEVSREGNTVKIKMMQNRNFEYEAPFPANYLKHKNDKEIQLLLEFDGDYVDVWINSKNEYLGKYYAAPQDTQNQIHYLVAGDEAEGTFDAAKIYWPRHADGSSDFDKKKIPPMIKNAP